jgi:hypothetical protein
LHAELPKSRDESRTIELSCLKLATPWATAGEGCFVSRSIGTFDRATQQSAAGRGAMKRALRHARRQIVPDTLVTQGHDVSNPNQR